MTPVALADTHALWQVVLGMGAVVLAVVIILMMLLLSLVKDIRASVGGGRISLRRSSPPPADAPATAPGRLSARGPRPWE